MVSSPNRLALEIPAREKQSVALSSLFAAALLTGLKVVVGLATGSLGILSEAAHSALDLVAALVTYISVSLADRPADSSHPFGHGKFEHLSAFIETALLLITCVWIVWEAARRLLLNEVHVNPSFWAFAVMLISIAIDVMRSRSLSRAARKYHSQALEADALHFSTDIYGSAAVIVGLVLILVSHHWKIAWLRVADPASALFVGGVTVYISLRLGKRTLDALMDAAPVGIAARIAKVIAGTPGVLRHDRIRVRQSGNQLFVDLRLTLQSNIPLEHAQAVEDLVESKVREMFPGADIVIHSAPQTPSAGDLVEKIRAVAHRNNFQIHDVTPLEIQGKVNLNLDLELEPSLTLQTAHQRATDLENEIKREIPQVNEVNIHIEPMLNQVERAREAEWLRQGMEKKLLAIARETPGLVDCHSLFVHQAGSNILVSLHCTLDPSLPLARVHDITENLEFRFRKEFPQIMKVSIHAEPGSQPS
ncbi:MAG TPA: cation-efflux pump [Terriglobia bacterium]|nr:cation-efflux pump [Terriglobia bacterium]